MESNTRQLDGTTTSMSVMDLNNLVVSMRPLVNQAKVHIINKLANNVKKYRKKKGNESQVEANKKKADRFGQEIMVLKQLKPDRVSKFCLANTLTFDEAAKQNDPETRVLTRVATHKVMQQKITSWREKHEDWKSLAAFILSKNTGRRIKKKKMPDDFEEKPRKGQDKIVNNKDKESGNETQIAVDSKEKLSKKSDGNEESDDLASKLSNALIEQSNELDADDNESSSSSNEQDDTAENSNVENSEDGDNSDEDEQNSDSDNSEGNSDSGERLKAEESDPKDGDSNHETDQNETGVETSNVGDSDSQLASSVSVREKESAVTSKSESVSKIKQTKGKGAKSGRTCVTSKDMVVTQFNLKQMGDDVEDIPVAKRESKGVDFLFNAKDEESKPKTKTKKRDTFFMMNSDDEVESSDDEVDDYNDDNEDEDQSRERKKMESVFVGALSGAKKNVQGKTRAKGAYPESKSSGKVQSQQQQPKQESASQSGGLHPSWEASRKRKQQQSAIQSFAGKKTKFDDSDSD